tara:strand:+ start:332 stop:862 length:531 start_codon:yes stop_codon:yes gene_type:complete
MRLLLISSVFLMASLTKGQAQEQFLKLDSIVILSDTISSTVNLQSLTIQVTVGLNQCVMSGNSSITTDDSNVKYASFNDLRIRADNVNLLDLLNKQGETQTSYYGGGYPYTPGNPITGTPELSSSSLSFQRHTDHIFLKDFDIDIFCGVQVASNSTITTTATSNNYYRIELIYYSY